MNEQPTSAPLGFIKTVGLILITVASFTSAYSISGAGFLMLIFLWCLVVLARWGTTRTAFYSGLVIGMLAYPIQLWFFYSLFGFAAVVLWLILAFWLALFLLLAQRCCASFKPIIAAILIPVLWTGLEYFRSELYYLKFSWLNVGYALPGLCFIGMYGAGFIAVALVSGWIFRRPIFAWLTLFRFLVIMFGTALVASMLLPAYTRFKAVPVSVPVVGIQMEFEHGNRIAAALDDAIAKYPETKLLVLSEYTISGPPPDEWRQWCRDHQCFLVFGGQDPATNGDYYNTVFVVSTNGEVVFKQAKCVPIQFFKDGLPAPNQKVWESPWGKIGICICYDLSYTRVTDQLIRLGAQALIVPTMDVADWGKHQHELHARVAPVRALEYGVPIFRLASSGISQLVDSSGKVMATAPFPGDGAILQGDLQFWRPGHLPPDRMLAPFCTFVTGFIILYLITMRSSRRPRFNARPIA